MPYLLENLDALDYSSMVVRQEVPSGVVFMCPPTRNLRPTCADRAFPHRRLVKVIGLNSWQSFLKAKHTRLVSPG